MTFERLNFGLVFTALGFTRIEDGTVVDALIRLNLRSVRPALDILTKMHNVVRLASTPKKIISRNLNIHTVVLNTVLQFSYFLLLNIYTDNIVLQDMI